MMWSFYVLPFGKFQFLEESNAELRFKVGLPFMDKKINTHTIFILYGMHLIEWFIAFTIGWSVYWLDQYSWIWFREFFKDSSDHSMLLVSIYCLRLSSTPVPPYSNMWNSCIYTSFDVFSSWSSADWSCINRFCCCWSFESDWTCVCCTLWIPLGMLWDGWCDHSMLMVSIYCWRLWRTLSATL